MHMHTRVRTHTLMLVLSLCLRWRKLGWSGKDREGGVPHRCEARTPGSRDVRQNQIRILAG